MDKNLIYAYLSGELNAEESQKLLHWVESDVHNQKYFAQIKNLWAASGKFDRETEEIDVDKEFELLVFRMDQSSQTKHQGIPMREKGRRRVLTVLLRVAAILLLLYSIGLSIYYYQSQSAPTGYNKITTERGEKTLLALADGTKIWLNSETTLHYPERLAKGEVNVYLDGEAYFDVHKDKSREFVVNVDSIRIAVLGTAFNVKSYKNEHSIETTLEEGSIRINGKIGQRSMASPILMEPNQKFTLVKSTMTYSLVDEAGENNSTKEIALEKGNPTASSPKIYLAQEVNTKLFTSWKDGKLVFKSERLEDLAVKLERWYDVDIEIRDEELKEWKYTGTFDNETIEQALHALSLSMKFKYDINKNEIVLSKAN